MDVIRKTKSAGRQHSPHRTYWKSCFEKPLEILYKIQKHTMLTPKIMIYLGWQQEEKRVKSPFVKMSPSCELQACPIINFPSSASCLPVVSPSCPSLVCGFISSPHFDSFDFSSSFLCFPFSYWLTYSFCLFSKCPNRLPAHVSHYAPLPLWLKTWSHRKVAQQSSSAHLCKIGSARGLVT